MTDDVLFFFERAPLALGLFELLEERAMERWPSSTLRVQHTQITFLDPRGYFYVSQPRRSGSVLVSFGLSLPLSGPRMLAVSNPAPGRYTHHVRISSPADLDAELMGWIVAAHEDMAERQRRRKG